MIALQTVPVKRDIRLFAGPEEPLHASAMPELIRCSWKQAMIYLFEPENESGEAADTGSATHVAVAHWHRNKDIAAAVAAMRDSEAKYPKMNLAEATSMFFLYLRDPRNAKAEIAKDAEGRLLIEYPCSIELPPAPEDTTQTPIYIIGTLDQVRVELNVGGVWDLKTSKKPGWDQLNMYLYQIAIYSLMASCALKRPIRMGGLITPRHYKGEPENQPAGVFWHFPHKFDDIAPLIDGIRHVVASVRRGEVHPSPGDYCRYCPAKETGECLALLRSVQGPDFRIRVPEEAK